MTTGDVVPIDPAAPDAGAPGAGELETIARGTSWTILSQLLPTVVTVFFTPFVLHHLGVIRYGLYILMASLVTLIGSFDGGVRITSQRYFGVYAGRDDVEATTRLLTTLALLITGAGVVLSVVGWFVAAPLVGLIHVPTDLRAESTYLFRTLGVLITFGFIHNLFVAILQARQRFRFIANAGFVVYLIWVAGLYGTVEAGWGLRGIADVFVLQQLFLTLVIMPAALRYTRRAHVGFVSRSELAEFLRFGGRVQISSLTILINDKVDALVVGAARSARTVAYYNSGSGFAENVGALVVTATAPAQSALTNRLGSDGESAAFETYLRIQRLWTIAVTGWFVVAGAAAWWAITAWLGSDFRLGGTVAIIALAGTLLYSLGGMLRTWCSVVGRPGVESRAGVTSVVVNLVLTVPLAIFGGAVGVIVATALGQLAGLLHLVHLARRDVSPALPDPFRQVPVVAATAAALFVVAGEIALRPLVPNGGFGLLISGLPAIPGLAAYTLASLGWGPTRAVVGAVVTRARGGPWVAPTALLG